jgi:hypothetical protein
VVGSFSHVLNGFEYFFSSSKLFSHLWYWVFLDVPFDVWSVEVWQPMREFLFFFFEGWEVGGTSNGAVGLTGH